MMNEVLEEGLPDAVLFAGDAGFSQNQVYLNVPQYTVRGNCDYISTADDEELIPFGLHQIYLAHGHLLRVKQTLDLLASAARSRDAKIAVYGHTHRQGLDLVNNVYCVNPGALKNGEYALLALSSDGSIRPIFRKIKL